MEISSVRTLVMMSNGLFIDNENMETYQLLLQSRIMTF